MKLNLVGHLVLERIRKQKSAEFLSFSLRIIEKLFKAKNQKSFVSLAVERETQTGRQDEAGEESQLGDGQRFCVQRTAGASKDEEGSTPDAVADTGSRLAGSSVAGRLGGSGRHAGTSDSRPQETRRLAGLPERHFRKQFRLQERGRLDIRRQLVPREWILGRQD